VFTYLPAIPSFTQPTKPDMVMTWNYHVKIQLQAVAAATTTNYYYYYYFLLLKTTAAWVTRLKAWQNSTDKRHRYALGNRAV
jgi:hypothetical protein